jgi:glutathione S-transferase
LKIHDFPFAPNPRKLRCFLGEKGLEIPFEIVNLVAGEQRGAALRALNPLCSVPVLELDDGTTLTESLVIMEYLDELYPEPPLIGTTPLERARVRRIERIADLGVLQLAARYVHANRSPLPDVEPNPAVAKQMLAELPKALSVLEAEAEGRPFLAGDGPTIADCTLFAACEFARFGELDLLAGRQALEAWYESFSKRPSTKLGC